MKGLPLRRKWGTWVISERCLVVVELIESGAFNDIPPDFSKPEAPAAVTLEVAPC